MGLLDKVLDNVKKLTDDIIEDSKETKIKELKTKVWGNKADLLVRMEDDSLEIQYEDGSRLSYEKFVVKELSRVRNRDITIKRVVVCGVAFVVIGKVYKKVEGMI